MNGVSTRKTTTPKTLAVALASVLRTRRGAEPSFIALARRRTAGCRPASRRTTPSAASALFESRIVDLSRTRDHLVQREETGDPRACALSQKEPLGRIGRDALQRLCESIKVPATHDDARVADHVRRARVVGDDGGQPDGHRLEQYVRETLPVRREGE